MQMVQLQYVLHVTIIWSKIHETSTKNILYEKVGGI